MFNRRRDLGPERLEPTAEQTIRVTRARSTRARRTTTILAAALSAGLAIVVALTGAQPAQALDLGVSPARIEQVVEPGHVIEGRLEVATHSATPANARLYIMDLVIREDGGFEFLEPGMTSYSAATWISLSRDTVTLSADNPTVVDYTITVPDDAESGGHYAMVFCEAQEEHEGTIQFVGRVGCQFLLTVPGAVNQHLAIGAITSPPILFGLGGESVSIDVTNDGNVHAIPGGYFQAAGGIPRLDRSWEVDRITLLPGTSHTFRQELGELPWIGRVKVKTEIKYGPTALDLVSGEAREIEVLVISWKVLALVALVAVGTVVSVVRGRMVRRRKARLRRLHGRRVPRTCS